jgi:RNA polymerase sigma-70 factor (ECF subfamily)
MSRLGERLARGDPSAFAELYDACADRVHHYLVVRLRSRHDADDVLQETFVRLARKRTRLAKVENLVAYVFAIARNEAARWVRRRGRNREEGVRLAAETLFCEAADRELRARETADLVATLLERLGPDHREVVELKIYGGLTFRQISQVAGLPQGTVATRYRTALGKLRAWLAKERS